MTEPQAITLVEKYLQKHTFTPVRIDPTKLPPKKKAPDFEVKEKDSKTFYCEVKTPSLIQNKETGMFHWTTTHSKLRDLIHKAKKQFTDQDPNHSLPWVLIFTSDNFQLNWSNFVHCIQGAVAYNGQVIKDLASQRFIKETNDELLSIDMVLWLQVNPEQLKIYQLKFFVNQQSSLVEETKRISDLLTPYEEEEIKP